MVYFVNEYLFDRNSSVEHTEFKRLRLFKNHGVNAKFALTKEMPNLSLTLPKIGVAREQVVTLHDFFGNLESATERQLHVEDLHLPAKYMVSGGNNYRKVTFGDQLICEVYFIGGTFGQVEHVDWYDVSGQLTMVQRYDSRGFKWREEFYGTKQKEKYYERYYRPDGTVYLESYYVESTTGTPINSRLVLRDYHGQDYYFDDYDQLTAFFLDELNRQAGGKEAFIADRPGSVVHPLFLMKSKAKLFLWMATNHVASGQNPISAPFLGIYSEALAKQNLSRWTGIIVPTATQTATLRERLGKKVHLYTISPAVEAQATETEIHREPGLIVSVGRTDDDKGTPTLIQAFQKVHQALPLVRLRIYGYGGDHAAYEKQINDLGLTGIVSLEDYTLDVNQVYDRAELMLDASENDNYPLAMAEALAHGVPVLSYDYPYGPHELIQNRVNGRLVANGDPNAFADAIIALMEDDDQRAKLSVGARATAGIDGEGAWKEWQTALGLK
ncbi:MAG TPA: glycosyltransferase [Candidatus Limosilactobacillus faecipullorum]|nr:glycosyltransferase [Candidatus Limosilactobacillus faecipullorum]